MRNYVQPTKREQKQHNYGFPCGTTAVLNEKVIKEGIFNTPLYAAWPLVLEDAFPVPRQGVTFAVQEPEEIL
ncbi:Proteasome subunit beta type 7 precursor protein [Lasiodiplodia theobromae]|uniref:Proteasome subunit beta type 7 precursor protein n=1 Tax=Lasiodiplodia theobromae TaxID=45133 RepID=UPI0015C3D748|nr:Proteasome subunit beta type 7 precursor protein [Lasiodiplodia theobromae]KAF4533906.1 Proteasome subunit beta type 7 precursor protein [Lasiodiplodia theobromae]